MMTIHAGAEKGSIDMWGHLLLRQLDVSPRVQPGLVDARTDRQAFRAPRRGLHGRLKGET